MAITIRNKATEAMIRELAQRWKQGPSAVIARLAKLQLEQEREADAANIERRLNAWDEVMKLAPPRDPSVTWEDLEREMDSLFDYLEEEEAPKKP